MAGNQISMSVSGVGGSLVLEQLAAIPEEAVWLAAQKSAQTRRAYKNDVRAFMRLIGMGTQEQLRGTTHREIVFWENHMRETEKLENSTVRRRMASLSSLFRHLVRHRHMERNPAADVRRPAVNSREVPLRPFPKRRPGGCWMRRTLLL